MGEAVALSIAADLGELERVQATLEGFCEEHEVSPRAGYALSLALEELLTNVIQHGYAGAPAGPIEVALFADEAEVTVRIEDGGRPFDPTGAAAPDVEAELEEREIGGLGIHLVRTMVSEMRYERVEGRNRLVLRVPLAGVPASEQTGRGTGE